MSRTRIGSGRTRGVLGALGVAVLVLAACGDDDDGSESTTAESAAAAPATDAPSSVATTAAAAATTTPTESTEGAATSTEAPATTAASAGPASGEPVKVMQMLLESPEIGLFYPEVKAATQGRVDRLNENGGVLGRPVEIDICQAGFDPNKANECARRAIDGGYLAFIGSAFASGDEWQKLLEQAGIPNIGYVVLTPYDGQTPNGFPVAGGGLSAIAGQAAFLHDEQGCQSITMTTTDSAAGQASTAYANQALALRGADPVVQVPIPRNKPDLSAEVQQAISGGDCILIGSTGADLAQIITLLVQQGYSKDQFAVNEGAMQPAIRKAIGNDALEGIHVISQFASSDSGAEGHAQYLADQASEDPALPRDALAIEAWSGTELFAQAAAELSAVDPGELGAALGAITNFDAGGLVPVIDYSATGELADYPTLRNVAVQLTVLKNGDFAATDHEWKDPFQPA